VSLGTAQHIALVKGHTLVPILALLDGGFLVPAAVLDNQREIASRRPMTAYRAVQSGAHTAASLATPTKICRDQIRCASVPTAGRGSTEPIGVASRR
jgi:hypothetical protein